MNEPRDPPDQQGNLTFVRPRPGGGPRGKGAADFVQAGARPIVHCGKEDARLQDFQASGRNRLLGVAGPLLTLGSRLQGAVFQADVPNLRREAGKAVERFMEQCRSAGVKDEDALVARYVLCTFVDSAVFRTPWGGQGEWASQCLLLHFHHELDGGTKFFEILKGIETKPERFIDLLELLHVCLLLGFEGKYAQGQDGLADVRDRLAAVIRSARGAAAAPELSSHWKGVEDRRSRVWKLLPWWILGAAAVVVLLGFWLVLRAKLGEQAAPLLARLANQGVFIEYGTELPLAQPGRLKTLLMPLESAGALRIEEQGSRSVITLLGTDLFASGSAAVNERYAGTIGQVGAALELVPGAITVIGHTDDQPVRSLRFQDNFELSRERAVAVATRLKQTLRDPARVEWAGLGSTQPRHEPASTPQNRALNRRVEILHDAVQSGAMGVQP